MALAVLTTTSILRVNEYLSSLLRGYQRERGHPIVERMKTDLQVPFEQIQAVKNLGARFDLSRKVWYVPDGVDVWPFQRWLDDGVAQWMKKNARKISRNKTE